MSLDYRLDECISSKKLLRSCLDEGLVRVCRCEQDDKGKKDPEVINQCLAEGVPLVTVDGSFLHDNVSLLPQVHPGFLIVCHNPESGRTMTALGAQAILRGLKVDIERWWEIPLANSIVRVTETTIDVYHIGESGSVLDGHIERETPNWQAGVLQLIAKNGSSRPGTGLPLCPGGEPESTPHDLGASESQGSS